MQELLVTKKIFNSLKYSDKVKSILIIIIAIITSFFDIFTIGSLLPILGVILDFNASTSQTIPYIGVILKKYPELSSFQLLIIFLVFATCSYFLRILLHFLSISYSYKVGGGFFNQLIIDRLKKSYLQTLINRSEFVSLSNEKISQLIGGGILQILGLITNLVVFLIISSFLLILSFKITITISLVIFILYYLMTSILKYKIVSKSELTNSLQAKLLKITNGLIFGIREIFLFSIKENVKQDLFNINNKLRKNQSEILILGQLPRIFVEYIGLCILVGLSIYFISNSNQVNVLLLGGIGLGLQRLLPLAQNGFQNYIALKTNLPVIREIFENISLNIHNTTFETNFKEKNSKNLDFKNIELKNISFKYSTDTENILTDVNIELKNNEFVGIAGPSGSGKSTLIDLICGLIKPTSGYFLIDGKSYDNMALKKLTFSCVSQNVFIFNDTLIFNVSLKRDNSDREINEIYKILRSVGLDVFLNRKNWENDVIEEFGSNLSGGQRQKIGIARMLFQKADIIILDEFTSNLDEVSKKQVTKAIRAMNKTTIMISHEKDNFYDCDKVYTITDKKLIQTE